MEHAPALLEALFDALFAPLDTVLRGGAPEPYYAPGRPNVLHYREDYFASALHEVAHWCVAGPERRTQPDFGYWYAPDGRDAATQALFERVEVRPQALEWIFADACGWPFVLSADNVEGDARPSPNFAAAVAAQKARYLGDGLPTRAARFRQALLERFTP
jgi:elongation factor P hydroxylase